MPCPRKRRQNNGVPALSISLKILYQAGIQLARQTAAIAKHYALTIVPIPAHVSHHKIVLQYPNIKMSYSDSDINYAIYDIIMA